MATLNISVSDELKARAEARAVEGGFVTVEAYVQALLQADAGTTESADEDLEALLLRRLDSGPSVEFTPQFAEQFKSDVQRRRQSGGQRA